MTDTVPRIGADALQAFIVRAFTAVGVPDDDARLLGRLITEADLRGSDTHGVFRMPPYIKALRGGGFNARPNIRIVAERASTALIDGDNGMGHLAMTLAADTAIRKARETGVGWAGCRMTNHAGPAALYAMMPLAHDMIGLVVAVGSANHLPAWGSVEPLLGTNPLAVAVPAGDEPPVVMDMSPTVAAYGKVRLKAARGEALPVGWMIDRAGQPLTDPKRVDEGTLVPIGDYKGSALSLIIGLLAGSLNGAAFGREIAEIARTPGAPANVGQSVIALSVEAFAPVDTFKRNVDRVIRNIRASERRADMDRVWLPGEQSHLKKQDRLAHGIPMPAGLKKSLDELAKELKIAPVM